MRLGCGCLMAVIVVMLIAGGGVWAAYRGLGEATLPRVETTASDAQHAQEKIYAIATRGSHRHRLVELSAAEVNAFLSRNLVEAADIPLSELRVDLAEHDRFRIAGRTKLGALLTEPPLSALHDVVPPSWFERPVWLQLTATPTIEKTNGRRRYLRLDVKEFSVGRQRLPALLARLVLAPGTARLLRWPVNEAIEDITIVPGRAVVRLAS